MTVNRKSQLTILLFALLLPALNAHPQWTTDVSVNTPVATNPATHQFFPMIAPDGSGGVFIAWMETPDLAVSRIYAQHLSASGNKLWAADGIDVSGIQDTLTLPHIVPDGNGGAIISWIDNTAGTLRYYVQKVSADGQLPWGPTGKLVCPVNVSVVFYYQLIPDGHGGASVLWDDTRAVTSNQVYAQHIDAAGNLQWPVNGLPVSPPFTDLSSYDAVADSAGGIRLCYSMNSGLLNLREIYTQHVTVDGVLQYPAPGINLSHAPSDQLYCKITKDSNDHTIVIWQDFQQDPQRSAFFGQRIDSVGNVQWGPNGKKLVDSVVAASTVAKLVSDGHKGAVLVWLDDFVGGSDTTAHLKSIRVDSTGTLIYTKKEIASWWSGQSLVDYDFKPDYNGGAWVGWQSYKRNGIGADEYDWSAQHVLGDGSTAYPLGGTLVTTAPNHQLFVQMTTDSAGTSFSAWTDLRSNTNYDLYAQRLGATGTLPVKWVHFSAKMQQGKAMLNWETSYEENNMGFSVQRSRDGKQFDNIWFIGGTNDPSGSSYTFTDFMPYAGGNFYRLKQVDLDGKFAYSKTVRLAKEVANKVTIYPNPASGYITVESIAGNAFIQIYGVDGKKYKDVRSSGNTVTTIDISELPAGIYFLRSGAAWVKLVRL